jgi:chromosome segregation ATPase
MEDNGQTAYVMKKLFQNVLVKLREAENVPDTEEAYAKELLEQIKEVVEKISFQENRYDALNETLKEIKTAGQDAKIQNNLLAQMAEKDGLLEKQQNEINEARVTIARLRNDVDGVQKEKDTLKNKLEEMEKEMEAQKKVMQSIHESKKQAGDFTLQMETAGKKAQQAETPYPVYPGIEYRTAVLDQNCNILSLVPVERKEEQKENFALTALFSRVFLKKKIDIVKLVAEKGMEPKQLVQIKNGIEKGLSEKQLFVLINNNIPAEQMEEIIEIAVFENKMKKEG